jgi:2-haloacid dehalogenase
MTVRAAVRYQLRVARMDHEPPSVATVVFDLGGVLIEWDPRHLYRGLFDDDEAMEHFLETVCTAEWNAEQDRGRSLATATSQLIAEYPEHADLIEAYYGRWEEMLGEPIAGTVEITRELAAGGIRLLALSNWSAETFPIVRPRLAFLDDFDGVLLSGAEGLIKPDPAIYLLLAQRYGVNIDHTVFVDDAAKNVETASMLGFDSIRFESPAQLRMELAKRRLLAPIE